MQLINRVIVFIFFISLNLFLIFYSLKSKSLTYKSILIVENNIPNECGIEISKESNFVSKLSIKKIKRPNTELSFSLSSKNFEILKFNIESSNINLQQDLIKKKKISKVNFHQISGNMSFDKINILFQELFISGGILTINDNTFNLDAPIDSKVRLEYLFCVGEMFHPKYDDNK